MTKFMWFQLISIFFVLAVLVLICVFEDRLVTNSLENVADYVYQIETAIEENDGIRNSKVENLVDNLEYDWFNDESNLCFLVNHKSIQEIGIEIIKLKTYIEKDDIREFSISLELIKIYSEQYFHFMGASFHNIL